MRPPRLAEWIASKTTPRRERAWVLGDLQEDFTAMAGSATPRAARRWYWSQVIRSLPRNLFRSARPDPPQPPERRGALLTGFGLDVRVATRALRAHPGFSAVAILSLGFGIGAATAMFSVVDAMDVRPLPYREPDRLVFVGDETPASFVPCPGCPTSTSAERAQTWVTHSRAFDGLAMVADTRLCFDEAWGPVCLDAGQVSPGFFDLLGIRMALGRPFAAWDAAPGVETSVILSHETWRRRHRGDPRVIGARIEYSDDARLSTRRTGTIVGVLPAGFRFLRDQALWVPVDGTAAPGRARTATVVGRLKPGSSPALVRSELQGLQAGTSGQEAPVVVLPLRERVTWAVGKGRGMLFGITALVLAVAMLNVAGLFALRAAARRNDLTMRRAMGASRLQLFRHLLAEGLVIGLAGGMVGVTVAAWGTGVAAAAFGLDDTGPIAHMDVRVVSFGVLLSVLAGTLVTTLAAWDVRGGGPQPARERTGSGSGHAGGRLAGLLLSVQIAAGLVLVAAAGLLSAEYLNLRFLDIGYDPRGVHEVTIGGPDAYRTRPELLRPDAERALVRVRTLPGVRSASLRYRSAVNPAVVRPENSPAAGESLALEVVDASYLGTLGIPVVAGRPFLERDDRGAPPVVIVNRAAASRSWPGQSALGQRVFLGDSASAGESATVVGVVDDVERAEMASRHFPRVYRPLAQARIYHPFIQLHVRAAPSQPDVARAVQAELRETLGRPVDAVTSHESSLDRRFASHRINALAMNLFGAFAVLLAAIGTYGSVAYAVTARTREVGVRMALGARRKSILALFARRALVVAGTGVALGTAGSLVLVRAFRSFVSATETSDPRLFAGAAVLIFGAVVVATLVPARRAAGIDPAVALRGE
jgi:predicted permease